ncbi:MAG: right-handed parallel beta-helix repeat-containing protein, partial [Phycisphaerae bacterium]|nr:right-handed parallel beta-helix repeat-containing protein [Phycisphaerae bacterium]
MPLKYSVAVMVSFAAFLLPAAYGRTLHVDAEGTGEYVTIQAAVDAAADGDVIVCADGTYAGEGNRDIAINKAITVRSENGPANCIVDCQEAGRGFSLSGGGTLNGFTITNGKPTAGPYNGGGVYYREVWPRKGDLRNCIITNCSWGGVFMEGGLIQGCIISGNRGRGIQVNSHTRADILNCTIVGNRGGGAGGWDAEIRVTNCIIRANYDNKEPAQLSLLNASYPTRMIRVCWSNIEGGQARVTAKNSERENRLEWGDGNVDVDPCFTHPGYWDDNGTPNSYDDVWIAGDYHLLPYSPCIDAGTNEPEGLSEYDADGDCRVIDGDNDGTARVDMGADESPNYAVPAMRFSIPKTLNIAAPQREPEHVFTINNAGAGILNWTIEESCEWLEISPRQGASAGELNEVALDFLTDDLPDGIYQCQITLRAEGAVNPSETIHIVVHLGPLRVPEAFRTIREAVWAAFAGDVVELADGIYTGEGNGNIVVEKPITIRSANGPEECVIIPSSWYNPYEMRYGFICQYCPDPGPVIQGITVKNGLGHGGPVITKIFAPGGALCCYKSSATVIDCIFQDNAAYLEGGAIHLWEGSDAVFQNCGFISNRVTAGHAPDLGGGALSVGVGCSARLETCVFAGNSTATSAGGGAISSNGDVELINCLFLGNSCGGSGGAVFNGGTMVIRACVFAGNRSPFESERYGGAIANGFYMNDSNRRAGILTLESSVLRNNVGWSALYSRGSLNMHNCVIEGNRNSFSVKETVRVHFSDTESVTIANCRISDNFAGGLRMSWSGGTLRNCDIVRNAADWLITPSMSPVVENTEIADNGDLSMVRLPSEKVYEFNYDRFIAPSADPVILSRHWAGHQTTEITIRSETSDLGSLQIEEDCPWLIVHRITQGGGSESCLKVQIGYDEAGLADGVYGAELRVVDPNEPEAAKTIPVRLCLGRTLTVPGEYATIQAAIDAAGWLRHDRVLVADGIYTCDGNRNIDFCGKAVIVTSANGPQNCVVDCEGAADTTGFCFRSGEGPDTVLNGLTVIRGNGPYVDPDRVGGGIDCEGSSPTIQGCIVRECRSYLGGAVCAEYASPTLIGCSVSGNFTCGLICSEGAAIVNNSLFNGNRGSWAGGLGVRWDSYLKSTNCVISHNSSSNSFGSGGVNISCGTAAITNNIIRSNTGGGGYQVKVEGGRLGVACCNLQGGVEGVDSVHSELIWGPGNIDGDPLFASPGYWHDPNTPTITWDDVWVDGDYHLKSAAGRWDAAVGGLVYDEVTSPCVDAGSPGFALGDEAADGHNVRVN